MRITTGSKYLIAGARTARTVSFLLAWRQLRCKPGILSDDDEWNFPACEKCVAPKERDIFVVLSETWGLLVTAAQPRAP